MSLGNFYNYICPFCGGLYQDLVENRVSKLLHKGLVSTKDNSVLPTARCVPYHKYVRFDPCGHCCPEIFDGCRRCRREHEQLGSLGRPTQEECYCHYCYIETKLEKKSEHNRSPLPDNITINTSGGAAIIGSVNAGRDFVGRDQITSSQLNDLLELSKEENELLIAAADEGELHLLSVEQLPESWVRVKGKDFLDENDPSFAAKYLQALQNLQHRKYVVYKRGILYMLTGFGFDCAQRLKSNKASG